MGLLSAALLASIEKGSAAPYWLMEATLPITGAVKFSKRGVSSLSGSGHYQERVVRFGSLRRAATDRRNGLVTTTATPVLSDADGYWTRIIGSGERIADAPASIKLCAHDVAAASWFTAWSGRIGSYTLNAREKTFVPEISPLDAPLMTDIPRVFVVEGDWPNASPGAYGKPVPIVLGLHDSTSSKANKTSDGALPTLYVKSDANPFRYLVGSGWLPILRAYQDGTKLASTAFSTSFLTVNGKPFTTVDFTTTRGTSEITVDCYGLEHLGSGLGDPWTKPVEQLKALLDHFVYNDSTTAGWTGTWPSVTTQTDFEDLELFASGGAHYAGALYVDQPVSGLQLLNQWAADVEVRPYWKNSGKLGLYYDNPSGGSYYPSSPWLRYPADYLDRPELLTPTEDRVSRITIQTSNIANLGRYLQQLEVYDSLSFAPARETASGSWVPASE